MFFPGRAFLVTFVGSVSSWPLKLWETPTLCSQPPLPLLCSFYSHSLGEVIYPHGSKYHSHTDDPQICISLVDLSRELQTYISNCLLDISTRMSNQYLKLNITQTQFLVSPSPPPSAPPQASFSQEVVVWLKNFRVVPDSPLPLTLHILSIREFWLYLRIHPQSDYFLTLPQLLPKSKLSASLAWTNDLLTGFPL